MRAADRDSAEDIRGQSTGTSATEVKGTPLVESKRRHDLSSENRAFQSEPRGDRTHDPRFKRPGRNVGPDGNDSQALAITRQIAYDSSNGRQALAGFRTPFADSLLTVREVAEHLRVSTRTVYTLCDEGKLAHVRIANAIRVELVDLVAFIRKRKQ